MKIFRFLMFACVCFLGMAALGGCGKKGAPLPPLKDETILTRPSDLSVSVSGNRAILKWDYQSNTKDGAPQVQGFEVSVAVKGPKACQGCPLVFKALVRVPMPKTAHEMTLEPESTYYLRVQALGPDRIKGPYSKTVSIRMKQDQPQ